MQAQLKWIHSPDAEDLEHYHPDDQENFALFLQLMVGRKGEKGEEAFAVTVCTPKWLDETCKNYG